jgi:hypothetical protein
MVQKFKEETNSVRGAVGRVVSEKLDNVLNKNTGFGILCDIARVLQGEYVENLNIDSTIIPKFKFAPTTSVDVERSFSNFKNILNDRRRNLTINHLEQLLIIHCFKEED